jgi:membrane-bound lytic murein transglycosylase F
METENREKRKRYRWLLIPLIIFLLLPAIGTHFFHVREEREPDAWTRIRETRRLIALTDGNSLDYFIYRGNPMGYQLDLLRSFAEYLGISLKVISVTDVSKLYYYLDHNAGDVIACNLPFSNEGRQLIHYSDPLGETRLVLVQRMRLPGNKKDTVRYIKSPRDFSGDTVYMRRNFFVRDLLGKFFREAGPGVTLVEDPEKSTEDLVRMVSEGKISYVICQENRANVLKRFYRNIDDGVVLTHFTGYSWGVRLGSDTLREKINEWLAGKKTKKEIRRIYLDYYDNPKIVSYFGSDYFSVTGSRLSPFDEDIRRASKWIRWDWRLIASLVYEESNFRMGQVSSHNAHGLMQLMPETADLFGIDSVSGPAQQIYAGVKYLRWIDHQLPPEITNPTDRICFILAAYNVGIGKVLTAREKATKYGQDPNRWNDNVDYYLTRKSRKDPYATSDTIDDRSPFGEAGGFVDEIIRRYHHYRNLIPR